VQSPAEVLSSCAPGSDRAAADPPAANDLRAIALRRRLHRDAAAGRLASVQEIEALFAHLEPALVEVRFLDPAHPKKLMPRMRRLFGRTRLEAEEVELLRGVCTQMIDAACRTGAFLGERDQAINAAPVHPPSAGLPRQA